MEEEEEEIEFASLEEKCEYYENKYEEKSLDYLDLEINYEELKESSVANEEELEKEILKYKNDNKKIKRELNILKHDVEETLSKKRKKNAENETYISTLENEKESLEKKNKELLMQIRILEQKNDDLERRERVLDASLSNREEQLDKMIQENVLQQTELIELKQTSTEIIQRHRDELRDQKSELYVKNLELTELKRALNNSNLDAVNVKSLSPLLLIDDLVDLVCQLENTLTDTYDDEDSKNRKKAIDDNNSIKIKKRSISIL
eukprot:TRINITY_DN14344_c0_g1_i1.p1 TRINITY_DN14344_c0_g1~~TRINITY_DN14344_c0_g1_i1.p1  ORF type:complete len:263 (-),score=67.31 TRINITY_DN14344_c0_g1_i1:52-840(-)